MFRIARAILKNDNKAEDAVADAFKRIIKNIDKFNVLNRNKTRGLIVIYVRNVCFNMLRRGKIIEFSELDENIVSDELSVEKLIADKNGYNNILKLVSGLDKKYKEVFRLKYFVGLSNKEISQILDITNDNVRTRLLRARLILRKQLGEEYGNDEKPPE